MVATSISSEILHVTTVQTNKCKKTKQQGKAPPPPPPKKLLLHYGFASRAPYANREMQINLAWLIMAFVGKPH